MADQPAGWAVVAARANARPHQPIPEMAIGGDLWVRCKCGQWPRRVLYRNGAGDQMSLETALYQHVEHVRELARSASHE